MARRRGGSPSKPSGKHEKDNQGEERRVDKKAETKNGMQKVYKSLIGVRRPEIVPKHNIMRVVKLCQFLQPGWIARCIAASHDCQVYIL